MNAQRFRRLALQAELALQRGNPLLYAMAALCLLASVMCLLLVPAWQGQLQTLQSGLQQAQVATQQHNTPAAPALSQDQRNLEAFLANLGDAKHAEQELQSLFAMARGLEIGLPQGQYKMACEDTALFCNYRVQFPVKGTYSQLRTFIEEFLQVMPALSLDELSLKRETVADDELEARLGMTLVVRNPVQPMAAGSRAVP